MSASAQRVFQVVVFSVALFMVLGGGFFRDDADGARTVTYTLYKNLPPAPQGPSFCKAVSVDGYGLMRPCNYQPPFVWWLHHKQFI